MAVDLFETAAEIVKAIAILGIVGLGFAIAVGIVNAVVALL